MAENIITTATVDDYFWHIPTLNKPHFVELKDRLGNDKKIYSINLKTRTIEGPEYLSCRQDHNAEEIIFSVDRYHNEIDLADTCCIIQFETINSKTGQPYIGLYPVQFYDIQTKLHENLILIPWDIPINITQSAATVKYNFRFYKLAPENEQLVFNLNTQSADTIIVNTLPISDNRLDGTYKTVTDLFAERTDDYNYLQLFSRLQDTIENSTLCWYNATDFT